MHRQDSNFTSMASQLAWVPAPEVLPPILSGRETPAVKERVNQFYASVAEIFEAWIAEEKVRAPNARTVRTS